MKDLQFRLWDKKRKEMINLRTAELSDVQGAHIALAFEEYGHTRSDETESIEDYEVLQFTGLLDKNDKEVFEGDVMRITTDKSYSEIGQIIYNEITARFGFLSPDDSVYGLHTDDKHNEVIGNIYENPELLNK